MTAPKPVSCPNCGATESEGDSFVGWVDVKVRKNFRVSGRGTQGSILGYWLGGVAGDMPKTIHMECETCNHHWATRSSLKMSPW